MATKWRLFEFPFQIHFSSAIADFVKFNCCRNGNHSIKDLFSILKSSCRVEISWIGASNIWCKLYLCQKCLRMGFFSWCWNIMSTKARVIVISHTSRTHNTKFLFRPLFSPAAFFLYLVYYDSDFVRFMHFSGYVPLSVIVFFFMCFFLFFFACLASIRESWLCSIYCKALTSKLNVSTIPAQSSTEEETYTIEHEHIEHSDIDIDGEKNI